MKLADVNTINEATVETSDEEVFGALQRAINSGSAWDMEGSMGRAMMDAINEGFCTLGENDSTRAYGLGHIPSRTQVQAGTKGSEAYARAEQPAFWEGRAVDWADA